MRLPGVYVGMACANDVDAVLDAGLLTIRGDNAANDFVVEQSGDNVVVRGRNGTLVNGVESVPFAGVNALDIRAKGGDDFVRLSGLTTISNDVFVDLGRGDDRFRSTSVPCIFGGSLMVDGGKGVEIIRLIDWAVGQDVMIDGQLSAMDVLLQNVNIGQSIGIDGGSAIDFVTLGNCAVTFSVSIDTSSGNDQVVVSNLVAASLVIETGSGFDTLNLDDAVIGEDIGIFTGRQTDLVEMTLVSSGNNIVVSLDKGDDSFTGSDVTAGNEALFDGGNGFDTFIDLGGVVGDIVDFESIFP